MRHGLCALMRSAGNVAGGSSSRGLTTTRPPEDWEYRYGDSNPGFRRERAAS